MIPKRNLVICCKKSGHAMYKEKKLKTSAVAALLEAITKYFSFVIMEKMFVCSLQCGKVTSTSQIFELSLPDSGPVYIVAPNVHTAQWRIVKIKVFSSFKNQGLLCRSL